jgi:phosphoadenosine phosphosulfate reductase
MNADARPSPKLRQRIDELELQLRRIATQFSPATFASSLSIEDMVLTDAILRNRIDIAIFTLDTGRMHGDTLAVIDAIDAKYGVPIQIYRPAPAPVHQYVTVHGRDAFYRSVDLRKACCEIRKVEPLRRALSGKKAWLTGMRREQSVTRNELAAQTFDGCLGLPAYL